MTVGLFIPLLAMNKPSAESLPPLFRSSRRHCIRRQGKAPETRFWRPTHLGNIYFTRATKPSAQHCFYGRLERCHCSHYNVCWTQSPKSSKSSPDNIRRSHHSHGRLVWSRAEGSAGAEEGILLHVSPSQVSITFANASQEVVAIRQSTAAERIAMLESARVELVAKKVALERKILELERRRSGMSREEAGMGSERRR